MRSKLVLTAATLFIVPAILFSFSGAYALSAGPPPEESKEEKTVTSSQYTLTVLNPQGHAGKNKVLTPRLDTLKGKKIAMWLSATPDQLYAGKGAEMYDLLEKMIKDAYPDTEIVRYTDLPMKFMPEDEVVEAIVATKPDAVIAGFGG